MVRNKLCIAICDDDEEIADKTEKQVEKVLKELGVINYEIDVYFDGRELIKWEKVPDLLLLDIEMPGINGFQVTETFVALEKEPLVIFLTSYEKYVPEGYRYRPFDFVIKSKDGENLKKAIGRAVKKILTVKTVETVILKNRKGESKVIEVSRISYIKADAGDSYVYVKDEEY